MSIIDMLEQEHRQVEAFFDRYEGGEHEVAQEIVQALTMHTQTEELLIYPVIRQRVDGGDDMIDHATEEHQKVKDLLAQATPEATDVMAQIKAAVEEHVAEEEGTVFPALMEAIDRDQLTQMGHEAYQMKMNQEGG